MQPLLQPQGAPESSAITSLERDDLFSGVVAEDPLVRAKRTIENMQQHILCFEKTRDRVLPQINEEYEAMLQDMMKINKPEPINFDLGTPVIADATYEHAIDVTTTGEFHINLNDTKQQLQQKTGQSLLGITADIHLTTTSGTNLILGFVGGLLDHIEVVDGSQ